MAVAPPEAAGSLAERYRQVRQRTVSLCRPLAMEDHVVQAMPDASPAKWHLGHTTWFFEAMVLVPHVPDYPLFHPGYGFVFNSYYESQGARVKRAERGTLSRPTVAEVHAYRAHVDHHLLKWLDADPDAELGTLVELGLHHEQQHQELLLTDVKAALGLNPLRPAYARQGDGLALDPGLEHAAAAGQTGWVSHPGGLVQVGHDGHGFGFDNESPRHTVHLAPFEIGHRLVRNDEYLAFMRDGGYQRPELWHAEGWEWCQQREVAAPLYWQPSRQTADGWQHYTLSGLAPLPPEAPVSHLNYFEAHAYAQWAGARLPTEFEWEAVHDRVQWGQRWEWTVSAYLPYPGFRPSRGAVGEYNGKFMVGQQVLRGSSYATPPGHARATYRNFFHAPKQWQYTGLRLAR